MTLTIMRVFGCRFIIPSKETILYSMTTTNPRQSASRYYSDNGKTRRKIIRDVKPLSVSEGVTRKKKSNVNSEKLFGAKDPHRANPGMNEYMKTMGLTMQDIESLSPDHFDFQEGMFSDAPLHDPSYVGRVAKMETDKVDYKILYKKMERKYFRQPPEIKLLTWNTRQQIRYLHEHNPEVWTVEKLAESFPISIEGVKKLLKSKFVQASEENIRRNDEAVVKNWEKFRKDDTEFVAPTTRKLWLEGKINLPATGKMNLPTPTCDPLDKANLLRKPTKDEFVNIVKTYLSLKDKALKKADSETLEHSDDERDRYIQKVINQEDVISATYLDPKGFKRGVVSTFDQFKARHKRDMQQHTLDETSRTASAKDASRNVGQQQMEEDYDADRGTDEVIDFLKVPKFKDYPNHHDGRYSEPELTNQSKQVREVGCSAPKQKIKIPKSKVKLGKEFRIDDCVYDESGEFLYRIPVSSSE